MSKTKEEYMELAYKDGLGGFFEQLNEQGTTTYGIFDGAVTKQIPECAITHYLVHEAPLTLTLNLYTPYGSENQLPLNPVLPAGLEAEDLLNAVVKIQVWKEEEDHSVKLQFMVLSRATIVETHPSATSFPEIDPIYITVFFSDASQNIVYDRTTGVVLFDQQMEGSFSLALKTYLDSLS